MTATTDEHDWDVFISYSRDDSVHASQLKIALDKYLTAEGARPRVYLDTSAEGTPVGVEWHTFLEEALARSRTIVALYSDSFFSKAVCQFELHQAVALNSFKRVPFLPVLIESGAASRVPPYAGHINWLPVTKPGWIDELRDALGLRTPGSYSELRFDGPVADVPVNHTLPELRVQVTDAEGRPAFADQVSLTAEPASAGLSGSLSARVERGVAVFADLAFTAASAETRLVATAPGCEPVFSKLFAVQAPAPVHRAAEPGRRVVLQRYGSATFIPGTSLLVILDGTELTLHTVEGDAVGTARFRERPRLAAVAPGSLAVADWSGRVIVAGAGPEPIRTVDLESHAETSGLQVPGSLEFRDGALCIGMWNGTVWSLKPGHDPSLLVNHPAGVQSLAFDADAMLVGGLDGRVTVYHGGEKAGEFGIEPLLLHVSSSGGKAVVVGERSVYRLDLAEGRSVKVEMPLGRIVDVFAGSALTAVLDEQGDGVLFDRELAVHSGFHTTAGARLACGADDGPSLVFEYPDGSNVLIRDGRIGFATEHAFALSPDGAMTAVGDGLRTELVPTAELTREEASQ